MINLFRHREEPVTGGLEQETLRSLVLLLKEFAPDAPELRPDEYRACLDRFLQGPRDRRALVEVRERVLRFAGTCKTRAAERETELRAAVEALLRSLAEVDAESRSFTERLSACSRALQASADADARSQAASLRRLVEERARADAARFRQLQGRFQRLQEDFRPPSGAPPEDLLTGLAQRKTLEAEVRRRVERSDLTGEPFALLLCDVDDFRAFNESRGHRAGDEVLMGLARLCRRMVRDGDMVARHGGEEIAVVVGLDARRAARRARDLVASVAASTLGVTVSAGVAAWQAGDTLETLFDRADRALYEAKRGGKNRAQGGPPPSWFSL